MIKCYQTGQFQKYKKLSENVNIQKFKLDIVGDFTQCDEVTFSLFAAYASIAPFAAFACFITSHFCSLCKVQKVSINCLIEWTQRAPRRTKAFLAFLAFHLESNVCLLTIESLEGQESTKQCQLEKIFYRRSRIIIFIPFLAIAGE